MIGPKLAVKLAAALVLAVKDEIRFWRDVKAVVAEVRGLGTLSNDEIDRLD